MFDPSTITLALELAEVHGRLAAAERLAAHLGARALCIWLRDPELGVLVPAPGFPQTIPASAAWDSFLTVCESPGQHRGHVEDLVTGEPVAALALAARDGTVAILLGGEARVPEPEEIALPMLGALLRAELAAVAAEGRAAAAREAARHATELAAALDAARADLERALRARQELLLAARENEARKAAVVRSSLDAIITIDHRGAILEFNPAAESTFGRRRDEVLGRNLAELIIPPEYREAHRRGMAHYLATNEGPVLGRRVELEAMRADGSLFPVEVAVTRIELEGPPTFTASLRDITERRRADQERERLLGIVSHDLRNPLAAILTGAVLLLKRGALPEAEVRVVRRIQRTVERMTRMIADLLDFERSRTGGIPIDRRPARLGEIVAHAIEELAVGNPTRTILFRADAEGTGEWDRDRLTQVVSNLVGNALQHSPDGSPVNVSLRAEAGRILLDVSNQNRGGPIPPEELPRLFDPFRRGEHSAGLGLGLYIVRHVVRAHGGTVTAHSAVEGTTFHVELPVASPATGMS